MSHFTYAGHDLTVEELEPNGLLPYLMDTPSTKAEVDATTDAASLIGAGVCTEGQYAHIRNASLMAFGLVSGYLARKGMVLVDTKTEHGLNSDGDIVVADELFTMENGEVLRRDGQPVSFSKEFARGMVKSRDQQFTEEQTNEIAVRYIGGVQHLTGNAFEPDLRPRDQRIVESTDLILDALL